MVSIESKHSQADGCETSCTYFGVVQKHVTNLEIFGFLGVLWTQVSDAVLLHPLNNVSTKVLTIDFPVWLQVLPGGH